MAVGRIDLYINSFIMGAAVLLSSCVFFRHPVTTADNKIVFKKPPKYRLDYTLDELGASILDTSAVYKKHIPEMHQGSMHRFFKFYKDGSLVEIIKETGEIPLDSDFAMVHPKSVFRGKYMIHKGNKIKLEVFNPGEPVPIVDGWFRHFRKGYIVGDTIKLKYQNGYYNYIREQNGKP